MLISAAADARPDRVARAVYVDSGPMGEGACVNDDLPAVGADVPFPGWDAFEDGEVADLTPQLRAEFEAMAVPEPAGVARDPQHVHDARRYDVPTTVITSTMPSTVLEELMAGGHPYVAELARMRDREIVDLPTGHWPQLTKPVELAVAIRAAIERQGEVQVGVGG